MAEVAAPQDRPEDGDASGGFGTNNYEKKQEAAEKAFDEAITIDDIAEIGTMAARFITKDLPKGTVWAYKTVKSAVTPGFIKRNNMKKVHVQQVEREEKNFDQLHENTSLTIQAELKYKNAEAARAKLVRDLVESRQHVRDKVKEAIETAEALAIDEEFKAFHRRRAEQLAETKAAQEAEALKAQGEAEAAMDDLRKWRMGYYTEQSKLLKEELLARIPAHGLDGEGERRVQDIQRVGRDWADREQDRIHMQVHVAEPSHSSPLGIYSKRPGGKEARPYAPPTSAGLQDMDEDEVHDVHPFSAQPYTTFEEAVGSKETLQSACTSKEALLQALEAEGRALAAASKRIEEVRKDVIGITARQVRNEINSLLALQNGPPKRLPYDSEKAAMNMLKQRLSSLEGQIEDLNYTLNKNKTKAEGIGKSVLTVTRDLATLKEQLRQAEAGADSFNLGFGSLPVVVGRSLTNIPGSSMSRSEQILTAAPAQALQAMRMQSQLVALRTTSSEALNIHKATHKLDRDIWVSRMSLGTESDELNGMISRIANIQHRLQNAKTVDLRANLIDALRLFLAKGIALNKVRDKLAGILPWTRYMSHALSHNTCPYSTSNHMGAILFEAASSEGEGGGVTMGGSDYTGHVCGSMAMPRDGLWAISITITSQGTQEPGTKAEHIADETDFVTIKLGPSLHNLTTLGTFRPIPNPATGMVLYDVHYLLRGAAFAYRFEWSSSTLAPSAHLAVCSGLYEEYAVKELEEVSGSTTRKKGAGSRSEGVRVLSSFVKMLRVEESSGGLRETKLLEELIAVEDALSKPVPPRKRGRGRTDTQHWDTNILNQTPQRFAITYFLRILKAEILLQQQAKLSLKAAQDSETRALMSRGAEGRGATDMLMIPQATLSAASDGEQTRLEASKRRYVAKKRAAQQARIDVARDLVSRNLVIWDEKHLKWVNVRVLGVEIAWVNNGMTADIAHTLQEYNDILEPVGTPRSVRLLSGTSPGVKYFESPTHNLDANLIKRFKINKGYESEIAAAAADRDQQIAALDAGHTVYAEKLRKGYKKLIKQTNKQFSLNAARNAYQYATSKEGRKAIKALVPQVMLDMKKGLVSVSEEDSMFKGLSNDIYHNNSLLRKQALIKAKEIFMEGYMSQQRALMEDELHHAHNAIEGEIANKSRALVVSRSQVQRTTEEVVQRIKALKAIQYKEYRKTLASSLRFPAEVFSRATPRVYNCEHLKTKCWGTIYTHGVRCLTCGTELSDIHLTESQVLGYGTAMSRDLDGAVTKHTANERVFRFTSSAQLAAVEEERIRLEKEKRTMYGTEENFFYDFHSIKAVYEFDHTHNKELKQAGVFRQGIQWNNDDLDGYLKNKVTSKRNALIADGLPLSLLEEYDPLGELDAPPPTYRLLEQQHKAHYHELLFHIGRLRNYQKKITAYRLQYFTLLDEQEIYFDLVAALHKDSFAYEHTLQDAEGDLDRTSLYLNIYGKMASLWTFANNILNAAKKELLKSQMNIVGMSDAISLQKTAYISLHDEMKGLLTVSHNIASKADDIQALIAHRSQLQSHAVTAYEGIRDRLRALRLLMPGNLIMTKLYGMVFIIAYRMEDDVVLVQLPWCTPKAKAYIYYKEILQVEDAIRHREALLMDAEDVHCQRIYAYERAQQKQEAWRMANEEASIRRVYDYLDIKQPPMISQAIQEAYAITQSSKYAAAQKKVIKKTLTYRINDRLKRRKDYIGPPSGRPKKLSSFEIFNQRRAIDMELRQRFISQAAGQAEAKAKTVLDMRKAAWVASYSFETFIDRIVREVMQEVCEEALAEGQVAKISAERKIGIFINIASNMQYHTYRGLVDIWQVHKAELRTRIEMTKGEALRLMHAPSAGQGARKGSVSDKDEELQLIQRAKEEKKARKAEIARQNALCLELAAEERRCKDFYRWELKENLRERRLMREEEVVGLRMRKEELKLRAEALANSHLMGGAGTTVTASVAAEIAARRDISLTYEQRRDELKALALERRRRDLEEKLMYLEDKASEVLREIVLKELQKAKYVKEFGSDPNEEQEDHGETEAGLLLDMEANASKQALKIPPWLQLPRSFYSWNMVTQNAFIKRAVLVDLKTKRIAQHAEKDERIMQRMELKSYKIWERTVRMFEYKEAEAELAMILSVEELYAAEHKLKELQENMQKMATFCRIKGEEELHLKADLNKQQILYNNRLEDIAEAQKWYDVCLRRSRNRDKLKRKVYNACAFTDTESINGFHQRFSTERLRARIYATYFKQIVHSIVNKAEIIASERKLLSVQYNLTVTKSHLNNRIANMKSLLRDMYADEYLRMKRSFLNTKIFPNNRRDILSATFKNWVRFYFWNKGHQDAFKLKYEVIKQQLDINRQYPRQLLGDVPEGTKQDRTVMHAVRERVLVCVTCSAHYLAAANHSLSCVYHPQRYELACPDSCKENGLALQCMAHRKKRWLCCKHTAEGAAGCARKYHMPPPTDRRYDEVMAAMHAVDNDVAADLDEKLARVRQEDFPAKVEEVKRTHLTTIEEEVDEGRRTAQRFKDLKFV